jgi:hypothetical protein
MMGAEPNVEGNPVTGQKTEKDPHTLQEMRKALLSHSEGGMFVLRLRSDLQDEILQMGKDTLEVQPSAEQRCFTPFSVYGTVEYHYCGGSGCDNYPKADYRRPEECIQQI